MRPRGKVNLVALALIAAVLGGIYWVVFFSSAYLDNLDVKEAIEVAYNQSGAASDDDLRRLLLGRLNAPHLGNHKEDDGYGEIKVVGGLGITEEQVIIERDEVQKRILIRVEYSREVELVPTSKVSVVNFQPEKEGPIPPR